MVRTPQRSQWRSRVWSSALRVAPKWCGPSTSMMTARPFPITTGPTAQSGFDDRAEAAADRNDPPYDDYDDYDDTE